VVIKDFGLCFILLDISKREVVVMEGDRSTGADGEDKFIEVPLGTVVETKRLEKFCSKLPKMEKTSSEVVKEV
jgi:hypothetical protein